MLLNIIGTHNSWLELEAEIASLPSEQARGAAFEEFCAGYFAISDLFQFKEVYRHNEIPPTICNRLGYPLRKEIGIDGLGVTYDGKLYAWQAKFRQNRTNTPTKKELSTFYTFSDKADWRVTITNADRIPRELDDRMRQSKILSDRLDALDADFFDRLREYLQSKVVKRKKPADPHKTQREAIDAALGHFQKEDRGQLILPCGTGKTLAALWIAEQLGGNRFLVMVPSLSLMDQTLREWASSTSLHPFRYQCLCSDTSVDLGNDAPIEHICDIEVPVTTDARSVAAFLSSEPQSPSVLFSTYQSGKVLIDAVKLSGTKFDIAIFDEAHRTTGSEGLWGLALDDMSVPVSKRLFMTATPRIFAPHITKKAQEKDVLLCSMDDHSIYGKPFYEMTFGEAIERGHITDYRIIVVCVTDKEVQQLITQDGRVIADGQEWDAKAFAKRVALVKAIREFGLRKVFSFHGRVKTANAFTSAQSPYSIKRVARLLDPSGQQLVPQCFHVHGGMSSGVRKGYMQEFKRADIGIMSNARCLTEGVDVPAVDAVAFIDPKRSLIDIVQATGRALRIPPKDSGYAKEKGYIFIPVFFNEGVDPEQILASSDFDSVWKVIQAMKGQDKRLEDLISRLRVMQGRGEEETPGWRDEMTEYVEKVTFFNLPIYVESWRFVEKLYAKTIEIVGQNWDYCYGLLQKYSETEGHALVPAKYKLPNGYRLGGWVTVQRVNREKLLPERKERLESVVGWSWDPISDQWEEGFRHLAEYVQSYGSAMVPLLYKSPDGYRLGGWVVNQRALQDDLPEERKILLEELPGWTWHTHDEKWEVGFCHLEDYVRQFGHALVSKSYVLQNGLRLGEWVVTQRTKKDVMPTERKIRLEELPGWSWDTRDEKWENGFRHLEDYVMTYGTSFVPKSYISPTPDRYKLGQWVLNQRARRKGLSEGQISRLQALPGWTWNARDEKWDNGFSHLVDYVRLYGDALVPTTFKMTDGYRLGQWVTVQRHNGDLIPERRAQLEALSGWSWNPFADKWEEGFRHLEEYVQSFGNVLVPKSYVSPDGYRLGGWVNEQRATRKRLLSERKARLEALPGWVWSVK